MLRFPLSTKLCNSLKERLITKMFCDDFFVCPNFVVKQKLQHCLVLSPAMSQH